MKIVVYTHTIRWNGNKKHKIVTFTPTFEEMLFNAHPQASSILVDKLLKWLSSDSGIKHVLDYDQSNRLEPLLLSTYLSDCKYHLINKWIISGIRILDADLITILSVLSYTYKKLYTNRELDEDTKIDGENKTDE